MRLSCPRCYKQTVAIVDGPGVHFACTGCGPIGNEELLPQLKKLDDGKKTKNVSFLDEFPEFAVLVGRIAATSAGTEHYLCVIAGFLLRSPPWHAHAAFYAIANNKARIDMVRALASHMLGAIEFFERLNNLLDEASKLARIRNTYIHALWRSSSDKKKIFLVENVASPSGSTHRRVTIAELEAVLIRTKKLIDGLRSFAGDYSKKYPVVVPPLEESVPDTLREKFGLQPRDQSQDSDGHQ